MEEKQTIPGSPVVLNHVTQIVERRGAKSALTGRVRTEISRSRQSDVFRRFHLFGKEDAAKKTSKRSVPLVVQGQDKELLYMT